MESVDMWHEPEQGILRILKRKLSVVVLQVHLGHGWYENWTDTVEGTILSIERLPAWIYTDITWMTEKYKWGCHIYE